MARNTPINGNVSVRKIHRFHLIYTNNKIVHSEDKNGVIAFDVASNITGKNDGGA